ncbi:MAG: hypothetical protein H6835_15765 [Planctomycetes bacterium]|nr:hypothetical protein [Planctomycetota bacterium]
MRIHPLIPAVLAAQLATVPLAAQQRANVGDKVPEVQFASLLNSDGRLKLSDFRGSVVMIDLWGTH